MNNGDTSNRVRYRAFNLPKGLQAKTWFSLRGEKVEFHQEIEGRGGGHGNWIRCSQQACVGEAIQAGGACFAHSAPAQRQAYLSKAAGSARHLSIKGTSISQQLWGEIISSPVFESGRPIVSISLVGCEISARVKFIDQVFDNHIDLSSSSVFEGMEFLRCVFKSGLAMRHVHFDAGPSSFRQCEFKGPVDVSYSRVDRVSLGFDGSVFERPFNADGFGGGVLNLTGCVLHDLLSISNSSAALILTGARLNGVVELLDSELMHLSGERVQFQGADRLGPFSAGSLHLRQAKFVSRVLIDVRADVVRLSSSSFEEGGLIVADKADLYLEQVQLGGPLRVTGSAHGSGTPRVLELRNADAGSMSFARVDLSRCSFHGAHGLGAIDLESTVILASAPWWAGGRRFIADEYAWRKGSRAHGFAWKLEGVRVGDSLVEASGPEEVVLLQPLGADQVASLYRDLRRSLEAKSDMSSAADFYYGEMEMRRWSPGRVLSERILIWCYWFISGYGLRPARALLAWLILVSVGSWSLLIVGIDPPASISESILGAIRAAIPGFQSHLALTARG